MQQLYTNPTFHALSLTSLSSAHQRETHVANFFWLATATIAIVAATSLTRLILTLLRKHSPDGTTRMT